MSKKIFFIVLTCCFLVATFCVSFAGVPQVQYVPANVRAALDRPDCAAAPLIVPPVVEPLMDIVVPDDGYLAGIYHFDLSVSSSVFSGSPSPFSPFSPETFDNLYIVLRDTNCPSFVSWIGRPVNIGFQFVGDSGSGFIPSFYIASSTTTIYEDVLLNGSSTWYFDLEFVSPFVFVDGDDSVLDVLPLPEDTFSLIERPSGVAITGDIVEILISGLAATGEAMGEAFSVLAESIFINADGTGLSTFGILVVVFAAVSLGLSLTRWVLNFCSSWGNRNR